MPARTVPIGARALCALIATLLVAMFAVGCARDDDPAPGSTTAQADTSAPAPDDAQGGSDPAASNGEDAPDSEDAPTAAALATDRRLAQLVAAYAPISDRVNFLVTAETLREDAVDAGAGTEIELERAGVARVEARRLLGVLTAARPNVVVVKLTGVEQEGVRDLMLASIDARITAVRQFQVALAAFGNEAVGDTERDELVDRWHDTWDDSLMYARQATTAMQETRARLGLEPAPEESIR
ncbi:MAG: hypothetical protein JWM86_205 [Thermoleophilia bacterium]|nr:hypothetical protein [Thermoleophilia bacterium]